jgi:hypothetical protein
MRTLNTTNIYASHITFVRCLLDAWQQPVSESSPAMKLHLSLAIRHAMLLRDEDLRGISYSDIFMDPAFNVVGGTQNLVYLMASFHKGKTHKSGKLLYGVSSRHTDVRRCSVGALGFYFYDLYHVSVMLCSAPMLTFFIYLHSAFCIECMCKV